MRGLTGMSGPVIASAALLLLVACVPADPATPTTGTAAAASAAAATPVPPEVMEAIWTFDTVCYRNAGVTENVYAAASAVGFRVRQRLDGTLQGRRRTRLGPEQTLRTDESIARWECTISVVSDGETSATSLARVMRDEVNFMTMRRANDRWIRYATRSRPVVTNGHAATLYEFTASSH